MGRKISTGLGVTLLLLALLVSGTSWADDQATASKVVGCHTYASPNVLISSARGMSCRAARLEMHRYKRSISRRFKTPGGFSCSRVSGGSLAGQWRCVKGSRAFRFEFSD